MTRALLEPVQTVRNYELKDKGFQKLAYIEEEKSLPWSAVYDEFCVRENVPVGLDIIPEIEQYERDVTALRG
jgi:L-rhamnose isomerase